MAEFDKEIPYEQYYLKYIAKGKRSSDQLIGACPFHEDGHASFSANLNTGQWNCYAGCGSGNIITFHAKKHGIDNKEAYRDLCSIYGIEKKNSKPPDPFKNKSKDSGQRAASPALPATQDPAIPVEVLDLFKEIPAEALEFLQNKRGWSTEVIGKYRIGYNGKPRFEPGNIGKQRITIPIFDAEENLVNIRSYLPGAPKNKLMSWTTGSEKNNNKQRFGSGRLFPLKILNEARSKDKTIYLVEGEPDCLCGLSRGLCCITGTVGADNWKDEWNTLFKGLKVRIAYDNDEAGGKGMARVCRELPAFAASVETINWPEWMQEKEDLTDFFVKHGKTVEEFEALKWEPVKSSQRQSDPASGEDVKEVIKGKINELNLRHAIIRLGGKCLILNEETDPVFKRPDISFSSPFDFKTMYANQEVWIPTSRSAKPVSIGELWLKDPNRRQFEGLVFDPGAPGNNGCYNLYRGLAIAPVKGSWKLMQEHIYHVICGQNKTIFEYLIAWMADSVQDPGGNLPGVSIVMRGARQAGKGVFARTFGEIFGSHFVHVEHQSQLVGKFNQHLKSALIVFAYECFFAGDKQAESTIKRIITEPTIRIEPKGKESFAVRNFVRLLIASNETWVIPAGIGERRFLALEVENCLEGKKKRDYFEALYAEVSNGGREAMLHDLLKHEYDKKVLRDAPKTNALWAQIEEGMDIEHKFWVDRLKAGTILKTHEKWAEDFVQSEHLHAQFVEFAHALGKTFLSSPSSFIRKIKRICPCIISRKEWVKSNCQARGIVCGTLEECRDEFEKTVGQPVDWDE